MIETKWLLPFGIACIVLGISLAAILKPKPQPAPITPEPVVQADTLSDWQVLTLAIAMTESRFNPSAQGKTGDLGIMQLTEIYIREVNRIAGTDYTPEDAYDPLKSLHMFSVVQDHYNPEHDENRAIKLHNPGGAAIGYPQKVKQNLEFVKRMEAVRSALKEYELRKSN